MTIASCSSLFTISTHEHACLMLLCTYPQSTGGDNEQGEPSVPDQATPDSTTSEDSGVGTTSLGVVHLGTLGPELHNANAKSKHGPRMPHPVRSALTLLTPSSASKATTSTEAGASFKRVAQLPSWACGTSASGACIITPSSTCVGASYSNLSSSAARTGSLSTSAS
jgi:hypothetical protein